MIAEARIKAEATARTGHTPRVIGRATTRSTARLMASHARAKTKATSKARARHQGSKAGATAEAILGKPKKLDIAKVASQLKMLTMEIGRQSPQLPLTGTSLRY